MKESKRLICDDIDDFISGKKHYYGVAIEDEFKKEEEAKMKIRYDKYCGRL